LKYFFRYVNHSLDSTTLRIANNDWKTWAILLALIEALAHLDGSGVFMGISSRAFELFLCFGAALVALNGVLLVVTNYVANDMLIKLGGSRNVETTFDTVKSKWPKNEEWQDLSKVLREREQSMIDKKAQKKEQKRTSAKLKSAANAVISAARLSAVGRRIRKMGTRVKHSDALRNIGIDTRELTKFQSIFMTCLRVFNMLQAF